MKLRRNKKKRHRKSVAARKAERTASRLDAYIAGGTTDPEKLFQRRYEQWLVDCRRNAFMGLFAAERGEGLIGILGPMRLGDIRPMKVDDFERICPLE